ncbi:MAG TPA: T9SS type A sorting domain-containing protein [Ferruginibacter sp.]|nr:T9SS type A sorting domain-containing protein [Ferruginibacter sp.]
MKQISTPLRSMSLKVCVVTFLLTLLLITGKTSVVYAAPGVGAAYNGINALPVVLTPLKGVYSKGVSHLYWTSLQESNSHYFEIQRSTDGINFIPVGKINAKGSSDLEVNYSHEDISADGGVNYYRLKLLDRDGRFQYSNIEMVNVNIKGINVTGIYPAPFTDKVNVTVSSEVSTQAKINLFDNTGKLLISQQAVLNKGVSNVAVDRLSGLARGIYIIKVQVGETIITKRLIK